jgi:hypothetical protein
MKKYKLAIIFIIGAIVAYSPLLAPIHELGHKDVAEMFGDTATITSWTITIVSKDRIMHSTAGYSSSLAIFIMIAFFGSWAIKGAYPKAGYYFSFFWFGAFWGTFPDFLTGTDLADCLIKFPEYYNAVIAKFLIVGSIMGIIWGYFLFLWYRRLNRRIEEGGLV